MKFPRKHLPSLLLCLVPSIAFAEINAAGGKIGLSASLTESYSSNVEGRAGSNSSFFSNFSPRASFVRDEALLRTSANVGMSVERSFEHTEYNQESYNGSLSFNMDKGTLGNYSAGLSMSYSDGSSANYDVGQRLRSKAYSLLANTAFDTSERTGFDLSSGFNTNSAKTYGDQRTYTNAVDFHFGPFLSDASLFANYTNTISKSSGFNELSLPIDEMSQSASLGVGKMLTTKLNARANVGYSWFDNKNQTEGLSQGNNASLFFSGTLSGPFLPERWVAKTTSSFSIGYSENATRGIYDSGGKSLSGSLGLGWQARENTSLSFNASRSRRLAVNDRTAETSNINIGISERVTTGLNLNGSVGYSWNTYLGQNGGKQHGITASAGASQAFGKHQNWSAGLGYTYGQSSSSTTFRNFNHHSAYASLSYSY